MNTFSRRKENKMDKTYHLYGDNSGRVYNHAEITKYFKFDGGDYILCISDKKGDPRDNEFYTFTKGRIYSSYMGNDGTYRIK